MALSRELIFNEFCGHCRAHGIVLVVTNCNYSSLHSFISSDVDIAVSPEFYCCLDRVILQFSQAMGLMVAQKIWHGNNKCAYIVGVDKCFLQLDFFSCFSFRFTPPLLSYAEFYDDSILYDQKFRIPSPKAQLTFYVLRRVLKDDTTPEALQITNNLLRLTKHGHHFISRYNFLKPYIDAAANNDLDHIIRIRKRLRFLIHLQSLAMLKPSLFLSLLCSEIQRIFFRLWHPTGLLIIDNNNLLDHKALAEQNLTRIFYKQKRIDLGANQYTPFQIVTLLVPLFLLKRRKSIITIVPSSNLYSRVFLVAIHYLGLVDINDWSSYPHELCSKILDKIVLKTKSAMHSTSPTNLA